MTFINTQKSMYSHFIKMFEGRSSRKENWIVCLFSILLIFVIVFLLSFVLSLYMLTTGMPYDVVFYFLDYYMQTIFTPAYTFFILAPLAAVQVKRFHDINKSAWEYLLYSVLFTFFYYIKYIFENEIVYYISNIGVIVIILILIYFLGIKAPKQESNKYGEPLTNGSEKQHLSIWQAIKNMYLNFIKIFEGRALRSEFWFTFLFAFVSVFLIYFLLGVLVFVSIDGFALLNPLNDGTFEFFMFMFDSAYESVSNAIMPWIIFFLTVPVIAVQVRRFHDINKSAWQFLAFNIVIFGLAGVATFYWTNFIAIVAAILMLVLTVYLTYLVGFKASVHEGNKYSSVSYK